MDNRPIGIKGSITAFRKSDLLLKFIYPDDYEMPSIARVDFWIGRMKVSESINGDISGHQISFNISKDILWSLPNVVKLYVLTDESYSFGGDVIVSMGVANSVTLSAFEFAQQGDQYVFVEITASAIINEIQGEVIDLENRVSTIETNPIV